MDMGTRAALVVAVVVVCVIGPAFAEERLTVEFEQGVCTLEYYLHESQGGPNATVVGVASQNSNLASRGFGYTFGFDSVLKDGGLEASAEVGRAAGFGIASRRANVTHLSSTHALNCTHLGVGSLEIAGDLDLSEPFRPSQLAVSGGTGDFRFCRGVIVVELVFLSPTGSSAASGPFATYKITAHLLKS